MSEVTVASDQGSLREASFRRLAELVRQWRASGRTTTTAGVKSVLLASPEGFDETALGFRTFADFLDAADSAGYVGRVRQPNGHWLITLPEDPPMTERSGISGDQPAGALVDPLSDDARLRADVWATFLDWRSDHRRLWDVQQRRALLIPVDKENRPAWEVTPSRFLEIPVINLQTQREWMREFAGTRPERERDALLAALDDVDGLTPFFHTLRRLGLQPQWRAELQRRVVSVVAGWAADHDVAADDLVASGRTGVSRGGYETRSEPGSLSRAADGIRASRAGVGKSASDVERLRARMHAIIDRMSLDELAALPVRAEHLLAW